MQRHITHYVYFVCVLWFYDKIAHESCITFIILKLNFPLTYHNDYYCTSRNFCCLNKKIIGYLYYIHCVSKNMTPILLIWLNFTNSQHLLIIFIKERLYCNSLLTTLKSFFELAENQLCGFHNNSRKVKSFKQAVFLMPEQQNVLQYQKL